MTTNMKLSGNGFEFIKRHEGLRLEAYLDSASVLTIGYGHTGNDVTTGLKISKQQADKLLLADVTKFEASVNRLVTRPLTQSQFDALVSFDFNTGALGKSTVLKRVNAGRDHEVDDEIVRWVHATVRGKKVKLPGLVKRRAEEAQLWLSGLPDQITEDEKHDATTVPDPVDQKTVVRDAGVQATSLVSVAAVTSEMSDKLEPLAMYSDTIKVIFIALSIFGIAYAGYRAWKSAQ